MTIILIIFAIIVFYKSKLFSILKNSYNENYMSINFTTCIKGIFVFLVFLSHSMQYTEYNRSIDYVYTIFQSKLGQLIVCMFLFYSGYGIYESINKKSEKYIKDMPFNRIFRLLFHFDIALVLYFVLGLIIGTKYSMSQLFFSLFGWDSIGNSNWFIFAIVCSYIITYICFRFVKKDKISIFLVFLFSIIYILVLMKVKPTWWYDTILCYPLGMLYSYNKDKIENKIFNNNKLYILLLFLAIVIFSILLCHQKIYFNILNSMVFSILIVLLTMKINLNNKILLWLGNNVFNIYILQRIPMIIISKYFNLNSYIFLLSSFILVIIISIYFNKLIEFVDSKLFKKGVKK